MAEHRVAIQWKRQSPDFTYKSYNREHSWQFPGGVQVPASAAPAFLGNPSHVDPEEAFVASLSSCHMLTFLALAAKRQLVVDAYQDDAVGYLEKNTNGQLAVNRVLLRPQVTFASTTLIDEAEEAALHDQAHHDCFIANSVRTQVVVECARGAHGAIGISETPR